MKQYRVPISARLRIALDALPETDAYYFPHRRLAVTQAHCNDSVRWMLKNGCRKAGVPFGRPDGITFHTLRHTGASRMIDAGVSLRTVQQIGG